MLLLYIYRIQEIDHNIVIVPDVREAALIAKIRSKIFRNDIYFFIRHSRFF